MRHLLIATAAFVCGLGVAGCPTGGEDPGVAAVTVSPAAPTSSDDLTVGAVDGTGAAVDLAGATVRWLVGGVDAGALGPTLAAAATARGESWTASVSLGGAAVTSDPVTIGNSPPAITEVQISPTEPPSDATIEVLVAGWTDADDDPRSYVFAWAVDGEPLAETGSTLPPGTVSRGDALSVTVTPDDGFDLGAPVTSAPVTVTNGAPFAPAVAITPAEPAPGADALVCGVDDSAPADPDGDAVTYAISWTLDGSPWPDPEDPSAPEPTTTTLTGDTVPADETEGDQNWACRVIANDGELVGPPGEASVYLATGPVADFSLLDTNATSATSGLAVSPRDYLQKVSGWYFGHAT